MKKNETHTIVPVLTSLEPEKDLDCKDMRLFEENFRKLVLGMQQRTGSGGVHTHPGIRLLPALSPAMNQKDHKFYDMGIGIVMKPVEK